ncbi:YDG/SRA domain-containing protein [Photobacterium leiognathi]|uniref:YDG/SRA domain-containing protein n=1 Tax=Photobacterium leiognathi TaxID=553611 RepID=UPI00298192BD|nr:YDG/SRA domain-containing protein [Photobacterium leiognathi]
MATRQIKFGEIAGFEEGHFFEDRRAMNESSFHRHITPGIDGNGKEGTSAIVLSGGYTDDADYGDEIIYTGAGGNKNGKQVSDQTWEQPGNAGLLVSMNKGYPVRVIRGHKHKSDFSPQNGYIYGGLYSVVDAWEELGKEGFKICRFRLVYSGGKPGRKSAEDTELDYSKKDPKRRKGTVVRIVRDTKKAQQIKELYVYQCQVCGTTIKTKKGFYAEGAHIKPLGKPHNGDDSIDNLLCLCPNHHVMFDKGAFSIADDFNLIGVVGYLTVHSGHNIGSHNLKYHRECHGYEVTIE